MPPATSLHATADRLSLGLSRFPSEVGRRCVLCLLMLASRRHAKCGHELQMKPSCRPCDQRETYCRAAPAVFEFVLVFVQLPGWLWLAVLRNEYHGTLFPEEV